jgi:hypothetical protein
MEGKIIIVRSRDAGCLVGEFVSREGADITLRKARQLWQWKAKEAGTLIECSDRAIETFGAVSW